MPTTTSFAERFENLLGEDSHTVIHAMEVAAQRFEDDAAELRASATAIAFGEAGNYPFTLVAMCRLAEQFQSQTEDTVRVLRKLRGDDE